MLFSLYSEFYFIWVYIFAFIFSFWAYIKTNLYKLPARLDIERVFIVKKVITNRYFISSFYISLTINSILLLYYLFFLGIEGYIYKGGFILCSFSFYTIICYLFLSSFYLFFFKSFLFNPSYNYRDFYFIFFQISLLVPFLFLSTNFFQLFLFIELLSIFMSYKFVISLKYYSFSKKIVGEVFNIDSSFKALFFHYWSGFFSSILIFFWLIIIYKIFGTTELGVVKLILLVQPYTIDQTVLSFVFFIFFLTFLFKLGFVPFQFYKIEIYSKIPFILISFYTLYYFIIFFFLFIYLLIFFFTLWSWSFLFFFVVLLFLAGSYLWFYVYNVERLKDFLAYSGVINSILLFLFILILF